MFQCSFAYIAYRYSYQEFASTGPGEVSHCLKAISNCEVLLFYVCFLLCYGFSQYVGGENLRRLAGVSSLLFFFFFLHASTLVYLIS